MLPTLLPAVGAAALVEAPAAEQAGVPDVSSSSRPARIWAPVRATFQMRASSIEPAKKPVSAGRRRPVEVRAVPSAACWMLESTRA